MMKKLDFYLSKTIIGTTFVVLLALLSIDFLAKIIDEIDILGEHHYTFWRLIIYVLGLMPLKLTEFFPMALLIGSLMGLGQLVTTNELTVMQSALVSRLRIGVLGFILSLCLGTIILLVTEFLGVAIKQHVSVMRSKALGEISENYGHSGAWLQDGQSFINIRGVYANGQLADITIYALDDNMYLEKILNVKSATSLNKKFTLFDIIENTLTPTEIKSRKIARMDWPNSLDSSVISLMITDPDDLSLRDLVRYIRYQEANQIRPTHYALVFWQRIFIPLSTGVMFLLALPFVFGNTRSHTQGRKLFIGILLGLIYFISYTSIANIILLTGAPPILGALIPIILFSGFSFVLLWLRN